MGAKVAMLAADCTVRPNREKRREYYDKDWYDSRSKHKRLDLMRAVTGDTVWIVRNMGCSGREGYTSDSVFPY